MTPYRAVTIALDFDRTFTSDIEFWRLFIWQARKRGHKVYCVTGRTESARGWFEVTNTFGENTFKLLNGCIFCNHGPKRARVSALKIDIDIWIDDMPEGIGAKDPDMFRQFENKFIVCETLPVFTKNAVNPSAIWIPEILSRN